MRRLDEIETDFLRRFPQLPRLPRYSYSVLAGVSVFAVVMVMMMCMGLALFASIQSPVTPTPELPTPEPVSDVTCTDPLAPEALWQIEGANCVLHEEQVIEGKTQTLNMSYPYDLIAQYPFTKSHILNFLNTQRDQFWQARSEEPVRADDPTSTWGFEVVTETNAFSATVFSLLFRISAYTGGAHPYHELESLTFDLANQTVLMLPDIFQTDPYAVVAPLARVELLTKTPDLADHINTGTEPTAENFDTWALTNTSLILYFQEYQVGPYVSGPQTVSIPLASLAASLKPEFVP